MESQPLIARGPRRSRHSVYLRQVWTKAYPFLIAFYVTTIIILSLSGVLVTKRRDNVPDTQNPVADNNSIASLQQACHTLHCHSQQTTAKLLSLTPAGLFGADQIYAGNFLLGLGKILVVAGALISWVAFWIIDKEKYPLWAMDLLNLTGALTVLWLSWGGFDAVIWLIGGVGVYGVAGCS